jgi:hypothetical protein
MLGATAPAFRAGLARLEQVSGHESTDIRLSTDVLHASQRKLRELGLDAHDTTAEELYQALGARLAVDEKRLLNRLRENYGDADDLSLMARALSEVPIPKSCFALKAAVAKRLIKKSPPKKAMKQLGYRSLDSMLKHESAAHVYAACWVSESATWRKQLLESYRKLKASDFEIRPLQIVQPDGKHWQAIANGVVAQQKHNVLSFRELGTLVLLPLPSERPPAAAMTSMLIGLHEINGIRSASTYLKLCQVKPNFGSLVQSAVKDELTLGSEDIFDEPVSWHIIQRYYGRFADRFKSEVFEPHVQPEDLTWHSIEKVLTLIEPSLSFWQHTTHLGLLHDHRPVSFNIIDVAVNYCNQLPFEQRILKYFRESLWHELVIRYLKHDNVEQSVVSNLQSELVTETEIA